MEEALNTVIVPLISTMGACASKKVEPGTSLQAAGEGYSKAAKLKDRKLDDAMRLESAEDKLEIKLLLLGEHGECKMHAR